MVSAFQSSMEKVNQVAHATLGSPEVEKAYITFPFKAGPFQLYVHAQAEHTGEKEPRSAVPLNEIHYSYFDSKDKYNKYLEVLHENGFQAKDIGGEDWELYT